MSALDLFSRNETVSEVATASLKYFLLPVILGDLNGKLVEGHDRSELLEIVETYYIDFLQRVKDYEIVDDLKVPKRMSGEEQEPKPASRGPPGQLIAFVVGSCRALDELLINNATWRLRCSLRHLGSFPLARRHAVLIYPLGIFKRHFYGLKPFA